MNTLRRAAATALICALGILHPLPARAQSAPVATPPPLHDGQHDFDFNIGTWRTHITSLHHPASGPDTWVTMEGTVTIRKIWDGRGALEEIEAHGSTDHFRGMTLYLYDPQTRQWSQTYADISDGTLTQPMIGSFNNGRGELIAQELNNGRIALTRGVWSDITPNAHRFEISYSYDGGATWQPHFIANLTRIK